MEKSWYYEKDYDEDFLMDYEQEELVPLATVDLNDLPF